MGSITLGILLVLTVFLASYLLVGSFPELASIPLIGNIVPKTTGDAIATIKDTVYSMDILGVSKSSSDNLLVTVANTGRLELTNFTSYADGNQTKILNSKDSLKSGEIVVFELDWKEEFKDVVIKSTQTEAIYYYRK